MLGVSVGLLNQAAMSLHIVVHKFLRIRLLHSIVISSVRSWEKRFCILFSHLIELYVATCPVRSSCGYKVSIPGRLFFVKERFFFTWILRAFISYLALKLSYPSLSLFFSSSGEPTFIWLLAPNNQHLFFKCR